MLELIQQIEEAAKKTDPKNCYRNDSYVLEVVKAYAGSANANPAMIPKLYYDMIVIRQAYLDANPEPPPPMRY